MAKFANAVVLDGGTDTIRTRAATTNQVMQHSIKAYAVNDTYATVIGNSCGSVAMVPGDFVQTGAAGAARTCTVAAKTIATLSASSGATPNLHIALVDSVNSLVLFVTDETTDQVLTAGNSTTIPSWTIPFGQPT